MIYKIIITGIVAAFINAVIKKTHPEYSVAITVAASLIIFYFISDSLKMAFNETETMIKKTDIDLSYLSLIFKVIGIAYISEYTSAILTDAGETAIAKKVDMAGKIIIFLITLPVLNALLGLILSII